MTEQPKSVHVQFTEARRVFKIAQSAHAYTIGAEEVSRAVAKQRLKMAYAALLGMKGERFDVEITIRNADPGGRDDEGE